MLATKTMRAPVAKMTMPRPGLKTIDLPVNETTAVSIAAQLTQGRIGQGELRKACPMGTARNRAAGQRARSLGSIAMSAKGIAPSLANRSA